MTPKPLEQSTRLNERVADFLMGLPDGITIPFILSAGLTGFNAGSNSIGIAGLAAAVVGAVAMGISRYQSGKPQDIPHRIEELGLDPEIAEAIKQDHSKEKSKWDEFVDEYGLDFNTPDLKHLKLSAFLTGIGYLSGGIIAVVPFILNAASSERLLWTAFLSLSALFVAGFIKGRVIGLNPWKEASRLTIIAGLTALAAYQANSLLS